jgi:hypothetical protein
LETETDDTFEGLAGAVTVLQAIIKQSKKRQV